MTWTTPQQLAEAWGVSDTSIWKLIKTGKLEAVRVTPRCIRISQAAVDAYLDSCERVAK